MPNSVCTPEADRLTRVNRMLATAFGLPGRALLRPGQVVADLSDAERRKLLEAVQRSYPVTRDPRDGRLVVGDAVLIAAGADTDLLTSLQLQELRQVESALVPAMAVVRGGLCHPEYCEDALVEEADILMLRISDLIEAAGDGAPEPLLMAMAGAASRDLVSLARIIEGSDGGAEARAAAAIMKRQAKWLQAAAQRPEAMPSLAALADCLTCIDDAIDRLDVLFAQLGLTECDRRQLAARVQLDAGDAAPITIDEATDMIARAWRLTAELIARGVEDGARLREGPDRAARIAAAFAGRAPAELAALLAVEIAPAEQLVLALNRLSRRAGDCANLLPAPQLPRNQRRRAQKAAGQNRQQAQAVPNPEQSDMA
jgi:hypothetical protein